MLPAGCAISRALEWIYTAGHRMSRLIISPTQTLHPGHAGYSQALTGYAMHATTCSTSSLLSIASAWG